MSLRALRDWLNVAQIALAAATVAMGGGASTLGLVLAAIAVLYAHRRPASTPSRRVERLWTLAVAVALIASIVRAFARSEFLDSGVDFLLLMAVQRAFNRVRARENLQQIMIGAILIVIGAVVNADLSYPAIFAFYLPIVSLTVVLTHLLGEAERLGVRAEYDLRRRGTRDVPVLARAALGVAGIAALGGLVVFLVFPRFGVGAFFSGSLQRGSASGFSDEVRLGGHGRIKTDTTVVMRVRPLDGFPQVDRTTWHLRGNAYDTYEGGQWRRRRDAGISPLTRDLRLVPLSGDTRYRVYRRGGRTLAVYDRPTGKILARPIAGFARSTDVLRANVDLEDIGAEFLFAASEPLAARLTPRNAVERRNRIYGDVESQFIVPRKQPGPIAYQFVSRSGVPTQAEMRAIGNPAAHEELEPYLQIPDGMREEIETLTQGLISSGMSRIDKVDAVMAFLQSYRYTLDQPASRRAAAGDDPLLGFLFETKAGHCEYFATAMAVMLRSVDVPTRNVNGYYGGHWNDLGKFYAVRQADAHSWVEVHFEDLGWITFDPTPPAGRTSGDDAAWWPALNDAWEALRNEYQSTIIGFNLRSQLDLLENLGVSKAGRSFEVDWETFGPWLLAPTALLLGFAGVRRLRRRRRTNPVTAEYLRVLAFVGRRGVQRQPHESASAFAGRLAARGHPAAAALSRFAAEYERLRFGPASVRPSADAIATLRERAGDVRRALTKRA